MQPVKLVQVRLPSSLVKQLDHWKIDQGHRSRAEAVETLLREALARYAALKQGRTPMVIVEDDVEVI